jgi:hypothetical protein
MVEFKFRGASGFSFTQTKSLKSYDHEVESASRIRHEVTKELTASYANILTEHSSEIAALDLEETIAAMVKYLAGIATYRSKRGGPQLQSMHTISLMFAREAHVEPI